MKRAGAALVRTITSYVENNTWARGDTEVSTENEYEIELKTSREISCAIVKYALRLH